ncbi:Qat anti-phage system QueC-like protein QatC [Salegentibacter sp. T436]|jgi:7-cyano-7-deazaguanine synthase in queuosine biosynthesis|uniref:Qat anti-phage system QueC-like protein QatC n=1 Tax=Salegentibacter sp. T436 TaxID=1729720 RepID=UPI00094A337A|nr:Qat anti-phage system QueC-like protein QatC [Salegentibacter sp. T436]APS38606.1 hypothetical protein AO058_06765 [Salegentibacter sp. T436]|tara:strand:- start:1085 stop:2416 length:1332 start_codon:yes stop_codon:yes gene_type:complete
MKRIKVIFKQHRQDNFTLNEGKDVLIICTSDQGLSDTLMTTNVFNILKKRAITPPEETFDLLHFAIGLYVIDQVYSRKAFGFQGWSRYFEIYVPVTKPGLWQEIKEELENTLSFLSGDRWILHFRELIKEEKQLKIPEEKQASKIDKVALFSGGMDSFIGAIDYLEQGNRMAFVSHYKRGSEGAAQQTLFRALRKKYGNEAFETFRFWVQPVKKNAPSADISSRIRSFLFVALGLTIANSLDEKIDFIIPENGLISLNVPLTGTRLSSHSTRTTHPYYIYKLQSIFGHLGIKNNFYNPYQIATKGEMALNCKNLKLLRELNKDTLSCSHPDQNRWKKGGKSGVHCGYCVPCIIRQAAEKKASLEGTVYVHNIINNPTSLKFLSGADLRAFQLALERIKSVSEKSLTFEIMNSGPLSFPGKYGLSDYVGIYKRGMEEVADFLYP